MFGLLDRDIKYIIKALEQHDEIEKAVIFGSRAMGNYKKGSDVDIAIIGENVNRSIIYKLEDCLNEVYPLPYFFDIIQDTRIVCFYSVCQNSIVTDFLLLELTDELT